MSLAPTPTDQAPRSGPPAPPTVRPWRALLAVLMVTVCWLAFTSHPPPQADTGWDKLNHLLAFAALGGCAWLGWAGSARRWPGVPLALLAYGGFIEVVQAQLPGRSGEWPDLLADGLGIAIGLVAGLMAERARGAWARRRAVAAESLRGRLTP